MSFLALKNPLNKCANLTRQIDPPSRPAKMSCHGNTPNSPANITRQIHMPEIPPSPLKIPQAGHDLPASPPSPPGSANGAGGGGGEQVLLLSLECLHILTDTTYTHSIQSGYNKYINILL